MARKTRAEAVVPADFRRARDAAILAQIAAGTGPRAGARESSIGESGWRSLRAALEARGGPGGGAVAAPGLNGAGAAVAAAAVGESPPRPVAVQGCEVCGAMAGL